MENEAEPASSHSKVAQSQTRGTHGQFVKKEATPPLVSKAKSDSSLPPLLSFAVTNPVTYLKLWWKKVFAGEGIDLKLRIHPLTALAVAGIIAAGGFSLGRFSLPPTNPIVKYIPQLVAAPTPTPNMWRETAFTGLLRYSTTTKKFYLETGEGEAITLEVPTNVTLTKYVGRRIFATGNLNTQSGVLLVTEATDLELLPAQQTLIPTVAVSPSATPFQISPPSTLPI